MKIKLPKFENHRVLVTGDLMLDRYWHGATGRISPEAPVPIVNVGETEERPGGAGNVALNIAELGGQVALIGMTGEDEAAESLKALLSSKKVDCRFVTVAAQPTITKLRIISRHQQLIRLDFETGFDGVALPKLNTVYDRALNECDAVVLSDYGKGTLAEISKLITLANKHKKPVLVDPKGSDFSLYRGATLITPNQSEFEAVVGQCQDEQDIIEKGQRLIQALGLQALLITRSEKGMMLLQRDQDSFQLPTHAKEVFDVTGAGDTVIAVMATALAAGSSMQEATILANSAAGVVVGKLGTASLSINELEAALREHEPLRRGVLPESQLLEQVSAAKRSGERIVFTNGCFDILHAGHVAYLSQAAALGDRLIVGINDDASVKRLKGEARPVNGLMQRMIVISALECVDWVVDFTEDTPACLIESILPDVLVKGGDYQVDNIVGADAVKQNGGEVAVLEFIDGCSTTAIIESIKKSV